MPKHFPSNPTHRHGVAEAGNPRSGTVPANANVSSEGGSHPGTNANPNISASTSSSSPLSAESTTLARLRQKSISHPMQQCQLTIYVPPHTVGAIIGRGGRTILSVQREAMRRSAGHVAPVRISVGSGGSGSGGNSSNTGNGHTATAAADGEQPTSYGTSHGYNEYYGGINQPGHQLQQQQHNQNDDTTHSTNNDDDNEDDWTPVIIRGDPVGCFSAVRQILPLVDRDHDPDIVFEVPIHRAKHNMLVGKGGVILASLSATYETRMMIPPNEFMSNVGGGGNFWKKRQEMSNMSSTSAGGDAGSAMLFGDSGTISGAGGGNQQALMNSTVSNNPEGSTLPPNVIQLEGDIDKIEQCLVKMLSIVSGERWISTGVIVEKAPEVNTSSVKKNTASDSTTSSPKSASPTASSSGKGSSNKDETTAEAVIVKIWTPSSKLLNLGKIRKVQRKTNTVIRRKKLRFNGHYDEAKGGGVAATEREEEVEEDSGEPGLMTEEDDEGVPSEISASGKSWKTHSSSHVSRLHSPISFITLFIVDGNRSQNSNKIHHHR